ncbi:GGDEF domain-containing protein [Sulfurivirga caldicuralii]|uniref:GGDEF domain-containing protein n=1 Tax=Sulfurivirga caldicuralii TaxID=364032 RepID=UPI00094124A5|nr:GGDEF domain-containing protein [Sulfurivirga caldicuralii]
MQFENELERETRLFATTYASSDLALEILNVNSNLQNWLIDVLASSDEPSACHEIRHLNEAKFWLWIEHRLAQLGDGFRSTAAIEKVFNELELFRQTCAEGIQAQWRGTLKTLIKRLSHALQLLSEEVSEDSNNRDPLTHLLSRRLLDGILRREHRQVRTHGGDYALLMIDVDHFKQINDTYGHTVGDAVLKEVAQIIRQNLRVTDLAFRYGGEEILVVQPITRGTDPTPIGEKLRLAVSERVHQNADTPDLQVTISIGISQYSRHPHPDYSHLLKQADAALYRAKKAGRNRVVCYTGELI